jgi:hypothetical protein
VSPCTIRYIEAVASCADDAPDRSPINPALRVASFDHLVGASEQRKRHSKAEALGGFQIDDQLDLGGLLNWKIGWLFTLENTGGVSSEQTRHSASDVRARIRRCARCP